MLKNAVDVGRRELERRRVLVVHLEHRVDKECKVRVLQLPAVERRLAHLCRRRDARAGVVASLPSIHAGHAPQHKPTANAEQTW